MSQPVPPTDNEYLQPPVVGGDDTDQLLPLFDQPRGQMSLSGPLALLAPLFAGRDRTAEHIEKALPTLQKVFDQKFKNMKAVQDDFDARRRKVYDERMVKYNRERAAYQYRNTEAHMAAHLQATALSAVGIKDRRAFEAMQDELANSASARTQRMANMAKLYESAIADGTTQAESLLGMTTFWDQLSGPPATTNLGVAPTLQADAGGVNNRSTPTDVFDTGVFLHALDGARIMPGVGGTRTTSPQDGSGPAQARQYLSSDPEKAAAQVRMAILDSLGDNGGLKAAMSDLLNGRPEGLDKLSPEQIYTSRGLWKGVQARITAMLGEADGNNPQQVLAEVQKFLASDAASSKDVNKAKEFADHLVQMTRQSGIGPDKGKADFLRTVLYTMSTRGMPLFAQATHDDAMAAWDNLMLRAKSRVVGMSADVDSSAAELQDIRDTALERVLISGAALPDPPDLKTLIHDSYLTTSASERFTTGFQNKLTTKLQDVLSAEMAPGTGRSWADLGLDEDPAGRANQLNALVKTVGSTLPEFEREFEPYPEKVRDLESAMSFKQVAEKLAFDASEMARTVGPENVGRALVQPEHAPTVGPPTPVQQATSMIEALPDDEQTMFKSLSGSTPKSPQDSTPPKTVGPRVPTPQPTSQGSSNDLMGLIGPVPQSPDIPSPDPSVVTSMMRPERQAEPVGDPASPFIYGPTRRARDISLEEYRSKLSTQLPAAKVQAPAVPIVQPGAQPNSGQPGFNGPPAPQPQGQPQGQTGPSSVWGQNFGGPGFTDVSPQRPINGV